MNTIKFPDGYNGDIVECDCEPIKKDGDLYKLQVHESYLFRWCTRKRWESAMYEAYTEEAYRSIANEQHKDYERMEREEKYQTWLREENS